MRKFSVFFIVTFFFCCAGGCICFLNAAEIIYVAGVVQVQASADKNWKKAEQAMKLNSGDSIRTAANSKADIALDEAKTNILRVDPQTMVILNSAHPCTIDRLDLTNGRLYAKLDSIKSGLLFEVNTPSATIGVRGTGFGIASQKNTDEVAVYESNVYVRTFDSQKSMISEITLPEGFKTTIERFEAPAELNPLSQAEMKRWDAIKQEISTHIEESAKPQKTPIEKISEQMKSQQEAIEKVSEAKELIKEENIPQRDDKTHEEPAHDTY